MVHTHTESSTINFFKLQERIISVNNQVGVNKVQDMIYDILVRNKKTFIMATGGSKVVAYYLGLLLERLGINCSVVEPRDYFYQGKNWDGTLVVISASGKTCGIDAALKGFNGKRYLLTQDYVDDCYFQVVDWGTNTYDKEKSFISLASSLAPMSLILSSSITPEKMIAPQEIKEVNAQIANYIKMAEEVINRIEFDFKDTSMLQIISGVDTNAPEYALSSTLLESGLCVPTISDKGSFCHGRNNILYSYPNMPIVYLESIVTNLDTTILNLLKSEYPNVFEFASLNDSSMLANQYYQVLQMYYLAKKIALDKHMDLTMPDYNPVLVRTLYNYQGEM